MLVRDAMSTVVLTIGPAHTLRQAARLMSARRVGAAVVLDPDAGGLGILTERDILNSVGAGQNPDLETAHAHTTTDVVFAAPSWTLEEAARGHDARRLPASDRAGRRRSPSASSRSATSSAAGPRHVRQPAHRSHGQAGSSPAVPDGAATGQPPGLDGGQRCRSLRSSMDIV